MNGVFNANAPGSNARNDLANIAADDDVDLSSLTDAEPHAQSQPKNCDCRKLRFNLPTIRHHPWR